MELLIKDWPDGLLMIGLSDLRSEGEFRLVPIKSALFTEAMESVLPFDVKTGRHTFDNLHLHRFKSPITLRISEEGIVNQGLLISFFKKLEGSYVQCGPVMKNGKVIIVVTREKTELSLDFLWSAMVIMTALHEIFL